MSTERKVRRDIHANLGTPVEAEWGYCQTHKHGIMGDGSRVGGIPHANMFNVQEQTFIAADAGGTANAITLSIANFNPTAYVKYQRFVFQAQSNNTTSVTINVASLGNKTAKKIVRGAKANLDADDIVANLLYSATYDGTDLLINQMGFISPGAELIRKTADETVTSSTTPQNDDHLFFSIAANEIVHFEIVLFISTGATPDIKVDIDGPASPTSVIWGAMASSGAGFVEVFNQPILMGNDKIMKIYGTVDNGANAGTVQLQWAQRTSDASNTTVESGSFMRVWRG